MRLTELDYYAALDVLPGTPLDQIERAYRYAMQNYGADSLATYGLIDETERREIEGFLNEAMRILRNEHLRATYDKGLRERNVYTEAQMARAATVVNMPEPVNTDPQLPILPPRLSAAPKAAAPVAEIPETPAVEAKSARDRGWWPFNEKEKTAESAPPNQVSQAAVPPAPVAAVGEDTATAPLDRPAGSAVIPALDGRPIGGGELRQIREARGLKLEEIGNRTKISMSTLRAIEDSTFKFLPAPVYLKGFLRTYCKMLQIDADKVIADYMRNYDAHRQG